MSISEVDFTFVPGCSLSSDDDTRARLLAVSREDGGPRRGRWLSERLAEYRAGWSISMSRTVPRNCYASNLMS